MSTKRLKLPTRGALGNGLRVVAGAVLSTGGSLTVGTRGRLLAVTPQPDGTAAVENLGPWERPGTMVEIRLGPALERPRTGGDRDDAWWAYRATTLASLDRRYKGKSSAWLYTSEAWHDLLQVKDEAQKMFELGLLPLDVKAKVETLFWQIAEQIQKAADKLDPEEVPEDLGDLKNQLADQHICNFSVF